MFPPTFRSAFGAFLVLAPALFPTVGIAALEDELPAECGAHVTKKADEPSPQHLQLIANALRPEKRGWGVLLWGEDPKALRTLALAAAQQAPSEWYKRTLYVSAEKRTFLSLLGGIFAMLNGSPLVGNQEAQEAQVHEVLRSTSALIILDNVAILPIEEKTKLYRFLNTLPLDCKAIVLSNHRYNGCFASEMLEVP